MKTMTVFGTRPEAIKMCPLVKSLDENGIENRVVVTAQHRQMLDQVLDIFEVKPDIDLDLMKHDQTIFDTTSGVMNGMAQILERERPDLVFVHGDTTTTMATSLACYYKKISIAHVEAGLRTYDKYSPFPEEKNRHITGVLADIHLAPTNSARGNLLRENILPENIFVTGNTVIDALLRVDRKIKEHRLESGLKNDIEKELGQGLPEKYVLITGHRRENFGDGFRNIFSAYSELAAKYKDSLHFIYPVHLNPNVREMAHSILGDVKNFHLISPLDYIHFVYLMKNAHIIITDSGGIQEEAPAFGIPVFVTRDVTERPEAVKAGTVMLSGSDKDRIMDNFSKVYEDSEVYSDMSKAVNPYGDGLACERICRIIKKFF
ncbi:MAG: non-hydrolyzing UDP-N-acetylglucosamine 2-epimerase [Candidatus Muiribacteriaceae bacterium]